VFIGKDGPTLFNIALQLHGMLQQVYFINWTLGHLVVNTFAIFGRSWVCILTWRPAILTETFHGFP
jgi:hypothetical protein